VSQATGSPASRFQPYPAYKASGVDWLGKMPVHWEVKRLKRVASLVDEKLGEKPKDTAYVALENIESGSGRLVPGEVTDVDSAVNVFRRGDVLFGKLRPYLAKAVEAPFDGVCSTELVVLRPKAETHSRFLRYELLSEGVVQRITADTYGVKMPRASPEQVGQLAMVTPPVAEQKAIAAFLDRETAKIDALVEKKERLSELLEEERAVLIIRAVTCGPDLKVQMKDSGTDWAPRVPATS
jgi:type I restriction enzyme, S subunit